nr:MAG TPA: hypothetical protein [Caudoviricetes sp.]
MYSTYSQIMLRLMLRRKACLCKVSLIRTQY